LGTWTPFAMIRNSSSPTRATVSLECTRESRRSANN
jgi:hypothetical protein